MKPEERSQVIRSAHCLWELVETARVMLEMAAFKTESLHTDAGNVVINSVGTFWFLLLNMKRPRPEPGSFHVGANGDFIPAATS